MIVIKWREELPVSSYKLVLGSFKNEQIKQKRLESAKLASNTDHILGFWNRIYYTYTYALLSLLNWADVGNFTSTPRARTLTIAVYLTSLLLIILSVFSVICLCDIEIVCHAVTSMSDSQHCHEINSKSVDFTFITWIFYFIFSFLFIKAIIAALTINILSQ